MTPEEEDNYDKGLLYEKVPEILTRGHQVCLKRVNKIEERAAQAGWVPDLVNGIHFSNIGEDSFNGVLLCFKV